VETVVFEDGNPRSWLFYSKRRKIVMRKHQQHTTLARIRKRFKSGVIALVFSNEGPVRQELSSSELNQLLKQQANQRMHIVALQQLWSHDAQVVHSIRICPETNQQKHSAWCGTTLGGIEGLAQAQVVEAGRRGRL